MQNIHTLQEFLAASGAQYRIFDLGRRVTKISKALFTKIEHTQAPYPYPLQRHAWFGVLFWNPKDQQQHHIWFLKLPLDEQGFLDLPARNDFLRRALEQLGQAILESKGEGPQQSPKTLKDNPWSYTPRQDKMATFHAKALVELKQEASHYLGDVLRYLKNRNEFAQWEHIGVQGIADFCARIQQDDYAQRLANTIQELPDAVRIPLLLGLENETVPPHLAKAVIDCAPSDLTNPQSAPLVAAIIRALAECSDPQARDAFVLQVLTASPESSLSIEVLVAISGRASSALHADPIPLAFLEALARNDAGQAAFNQVMTDLLFLPNTGKIIRQAFRTPERSEALAQCIGQFLSGIH